MTATTHTTSKQSKNLKTEKKRFDYDKFCKDVIAYKQFHNFTYLDIYLETEVSISLLAKLLQGNYKSDLSINTVCALCDFMKQKPTKYLL